MIFGIIPFTYFIGCVLVPWIPKWVEIRVTLLVSLFFMGGFLYLIGPVFVDKSLTMMCIGLMMASIFMPLTIVPNM